MDELLIKTVEIVATHIANNSVPAAELPMLIHAVHGSLASIVKLTTTSTDQPRSEPAVPVKKSVHRDYLVSLEDGKRYQTLRRHLSALGMTPDEYRAKWGLGSDYPMTSAAYSQKRSELSKALGLGKKKSAEPVEVPTAAKKSHRKLAQQVEAEAPADAPKAIHDAPEAVQEAA